MSKSGEIQNGRIALADGRSLPAGFNTFTHGYAVTSHSSQSKTVDDVLLVASSKSFAAVNREQFYVSHFPWPGTLSTSSPMTPICSPAASRIRTNARPPSNCKPSAMTWPNSVSSARNGWKKKLRRRSVAVRKIFRRRAPDAPDRDAPVTRLAPVQRLAQVVEDCAAGSANGWASSKRRRSSRNKKSTETVKPAEKIAPAVKETPGQKLRREIEQSRQRSNNNAAPAACTFNAYAKLQR